MNPDQLLKYFERISEAPDAISRLRRFILDLAVRGKLVEQDPNDEPASELLKRIQAEKARLVKAGKGSKEKLLSPVGEDIDFNIPSAWVWTRLGIVTSYIQRGKSPKYATSNGSLVVSQKCVQWWGLDLAVAKQVTLESLDDYESIRFLRSGDLLWNSTGTGTIGRVVRLVDPPNKLVCDSHVTVVRCMGVDPEYIRIWLRSDHVYALIEDRAAGSTNQVELTAQMAINQIVPLPPLAEQNRIVAKVDELMNLCNKLEAAKAEREKNRDRLVSVSLQRLNQPSDDEDIFRDDARFIFDNLPRLTTRPAHIKQLRQTILNLAVRGRFCSKNEFDVEQTVVQELREIRQSVCLSLSEKSKVLAEFERLEKVWSQNENQPRYITTICACHFITKGTTPANNELLPRGDIPFLKVYNIVNNKIDFNYRPTFISRQVHEKVLTRSAVKPGDVIMNIVGPPLGKVALVGNQFSEWNINQALAFFRPLPMFDNQFLSLVLSAPITIEQVLKETRGTVGQDNLSLEQVRSLELPFIPLAVQCRIVAKVNHLMMLCDQLEDQLTITEANNRRLLEAVLHEALSPALAEA
jgi:type I restriction enzyme, S subunit